jgi:DNA polymerase-4
VFAHELQQKIYEDLGFTVNIGVSSNKLLAKMASEMKKPNQVISLYPEEVPLKMWPLPVSELFYVGRATQVTLKKLGIETIGELAHTDLSILKSHFKSHGETIYHYANGEDLDLDLERKISNKGYGNSTTLAKDVTDAEEAKLILLSLCETVATRVRADSSFIQVISISIVYSDFSHQGKQITLPSPLNTTIEIHEYACQLFDILWNHAPIRQLGVSTSHATKSRIYQYNIFDMDRSERLEKADAAVDKIRNTYGKDSILRASFLNQSKKHMIGGFSTFGNKEKIDPNEDTNLNK